MWDLIVSVLDHCLSFYFAVEYSSCFISVMILFHTLMRKGPSREPNNFYVYMNHGRTGGEVAAA